MRMKLVALLCLGLGAAPLGARAQSAAPIGQWSTADGHERLMVTQNGYCDFAAEGPSGQTHVLGSCSWRSSSRGGILTIMNTNQFKPAPIYYNIVWINQRSISVWGDVFFRRA